MHTLFPSLRSRLPGLTITVAHVDLHVQDDDFLQTIKRVLAVPPLPPQGAPNVSATASSHQPSLHSRQVIGSTSFPVLPALAHAPNLFNHRNTSLFARSIILVLLTCRCRP